MKRNISEEQTAMSMKNEPWNLEEKSDAANVRQIVRNVRKRRLTKGIRRHYVDMLMRLRQEYMEQMEFHREDALFSKKDSGERSEISANLIAVGTDNFRHDIELGLMTDESSVILMIEEALQRIKNDEFGFCLDCGCQINSERLEAKPYARFCTACKTKRESKEVSLVKSR